MKKARQEQVEQVRLRDCQYLKLDWLRRSFWGELQQLPLWARAHKGSFICTLMQASLQRFLKIETGLAAPILEGGGTNPSMPGTLVPNEKSKTRAGRTSSPV